MKVLLIHQAFVSPEEAGGTRHFEFGKYLAQQGCSLTIIASQVSYLSGKKVHADLSASTEESIDGVRILRAKVYSQLHSSFTTRVISYLSFMASSAWLGIKGERPDLIMGTSPPIFQAVSAWFVAIVRRRPFLLEIRDLWPEFAIDMGILRNPVLIWLSRRLEQFLYSRADHLLVNSPAYKEYLVAKGIDEGKITLIPNGVNAEAFIHVQAHTDIRKEFDLGASFVVTYAGALGAANDIPVILQAAQRMKEHNDVKFLLVGDGKDKKILQEYCKEHALSNVIFAGARPKNSMPEILQASDICLATLLNIPMFRTTYPNKVFDYMAAGKPTLLAIDGVIREVIESASGGLYIPPGDVAALVAGILRLKQNRGEAEKMGLNARAYVLANFDRHQHAVRFLELAKSMVG